MSDQRIIFSPERNQWTLADGRHHMEVPEWAREIMRDEFERETRPLRDSLDLALDSKRIAERRVTELLDENAKLRELVRAAWRCIHTGASCSDCRLIAGGCTLQTAMRELGVEVTA